MRDSLSFYGEHVGFLLPPIRQDRTSSFKVQVGKPSAQAIPLPIKRSLACLMSDGLGKLYPDVFKMYCNASSSNA